LNFAVQDVQEVDFLNRDSTTNLHRFKLEIKAKLMNLPVVNLPSQKSRVQEPIEVDAIP